MTFGPTSDDYLRNNLHNHPDAYWCPDCHRFTLDCRHLVEPLNDAPRVILGNWLFIYAAYDRQKRILEVCFNHGVRRQYPNVPLAAALGLVRATDPAHHWKENIERHYRFAQVRGRYYTERAILNGDGKGARDRLRQTTIEPRRRSFTPNGT